ncbi:N-terminal acetyltransferase A, auxiliary subunit [Pholiota conissans]|uniref:N-terminal acetyltransferase A, auxiliary subunit n=1 Tax=Pholiota conissans TaxID=109636 RepID=A0A9P5ZAZ9_9AGAR|nr:N-terminal acetyltransferase A, auxiliary subunit [Pholiota conissans]
MSKALARKTPLPSKEATLFKELLTLYETRQIKKGLKTADQILKKFPEHGETLCMKGLVLTHMNRREEGIELVKKGVRLDLTSHICWHVFGLIQKADKNYEEALKSYTQALKFDKDNMNLLRDSAQLQTHMRLYDGLVETRHTILKLRPNQRQNWIALAVAHRLAGNPEEARNILEHYQRSLKNVPDYDTEHSETLLFYISILEDLGDFTQALSVLDSNSRSRSIVDRTAILETRARILTKQKASETEEAWHALIQHNADSYESYRGFFASQGISLDHPNPEALAKLEEFIVQLPRAAAPRRLLLKVASGDKFAELAKSYLVQGLTKGIPSLFVDVKSLYVDAEKRDTIERIVEGLREEYAPEKASANVEPTSYLWSLYFLAQHYSFLSQPAKSLALLDIGIEHTPTLPELHLARARALKRGGDFFGAARAANEARLLDGQDRFLNTKCGKYLMRAGMVKEAEDMLGLFTKKDAPSPAADLEDMQSMLFLLESAAAYSSIGRPNMALKRYLAVKKVFDDFEDDQYDFHGYNLRKFTINIYLKLLSWEDHLRSDPSYVTAAIEASKIFVEVSDDPSIVTTLTSSNQLTDAEKKAKKKAKKAAQKVQEEKKAAPANDNKELDPPPPKDEDPDGLKVIASSDGLEQAAKLLEPLKSLAANNIDAWISIYDVAIRRKKLLQAVGALKRAVALNADHPELHVRLVDLKLRAASLPKTPPAPIGPVFTAALSKLIPAEVSLETFNSQYLQRHSANGKAILAAARVLRRLEAHLGEVENAVFGIFAQDVQLDIPTAVAAYRFLSSLKSSRTEDFSTAAQARFPPSTVFKAPSEQAALRKVVLENEWQVDAQDEKTTAET